MVGVERMRKEGTEMVNIPGHYIEWKKRRRRSRRRNEETE